MLSQTSAARPEVQTLELRDAAGTHLARLAAFFLLQRPMISGCHDTLFCKGKRRGLVLLIALLTGCTFIAILIAPAAAQDGIKAEWDGNWDTRWRDGGAQLLLEQTGSIVTGVYPLYSGRVEAVAVGRELRGRWIEEGRTGTFVFVQSQDGRSFAGRFESGEWWTGSRAVTDLVQPVAVDQSSPMATMRGFLTAANRAVDGDLEALGIAVALVRPEDGVKDDADHFDHARALYSVIDQTTFRLWDLPHEREDDGNTATVLLEQAGTGEDVIVTFQQEEGLWYLSAPPIDSLEATHERLAFARALATEGALEGPGLQSPRETMRRFLLSFRYSPDGSDPAALAALDLRGRQEVTRTHDGQVLAGYLKRVIDRAGYVIWQEIPDDPTSQVPYVHFQHPEGNVVIAPVETDEGPTWQFTPDTLRTIRAVYTAMEDMPLAPGVTALEDRDIHFVIRSTLRGMAPATLLPIGPLERWQWGGLALTVILAFGTAHLARRGVGGITRRAVRVDAESHPISASIASWAIRALVVGLVLLAAGWVLGLPEGFTEVLATIAVVLVVLGLFLLGWQAIGALAEKYRDAKRIGVHNLILLSLVSGVLRGTLLLAAVLAIAHMLSLPLTSVLAGFGIGGIAFALAVQPTLQNLLSGFTLFADRPISVGDFCRFGDKMGTVEHIGLRSTRLRTLDRTVISVPNSQFLDMELENFSRRDRFLFTTVLQLRYETTPDQMRYVLAELRKLLIAHPEVVAEPLRVRLMGFGAHSLDVEVFSYIRASDIDTFAAIREDVLLRIMGTVDEAGAQFAFPSVTHYAASDESADPERVQSAEAAVEEWRRREELPFPDFDWHAKAEMSGILDYPPEGSTWRRNPSSD